MAKKEITALSSAEDRYEASTQRAEADKELSQWLDDYRNDPNSPRDIYDGVDYGVFLTYGMVKEQARIIANKYDYVEYGQEPQTQNANSEALEIEIGGDDFYIRGNGVDFSNDGWVPSIETGFTQLTSEQLGDGNIPSDDFGVLLSSGTSDGPVNTSPVTGLVPTVETDTISSGIVDAANDISLEPAPGGISDVVPAQGEFSAPSVSTTLASTDDSGSVSGTGNESGYSNTSNSTDGSADGREGGTDPGHINTLAGVNVDSDQDGLPSVDTESGAVDVSQYGKTKDQGNGLYEPNIVDLPILPNVLHKYTSWTYNIGWYMLDPASHESIVKNGGITNPSLELRNLIMRSGSTGRAGALGQNGDYYIENFRFTTIFGQNSQTTKSSNNFDIQFEVVEPYGVAFLSELIQLAQANSIDDHFDIPYLLEIKFKGYDDYGNPVNDIPGSGPKYIPIKIINITFKIISGATVYSVQAVPYAHSPLQNQWNAFIHESISIKGSTFEELMGSLFDYLNNSEKNKAQEQSRSPDEFKYTIHDNDLKDSKVGFVHEALGSVGQIDRMSMTDGENNKEFVQINGGSTLKSAIQAIASATDFGAKFNTVGQPESNADNINKPLRLVKIIPVVTKLGNYNTSTKQYSKTIVYKIETQKMYGFVLPDMPGGKPTQRGWQKEYNWIFTGKNQDIVDFEADYNIQYFNIRNSFVNQKGKVAGTPSANSVSLPDDGISRTEAGGKVYSPAIVTASSPLTDSVQNSYRGPAFQLAADHMDNVLNNPGADMITVNLRIIGDPDWIAQDKSILPSLDASSGNARITNGSISIDNHDVFFMLRFRTPRDYDPRKGLMKIDTEQTFVQGLYRVITIDNNFYDGRFEQTLKAIRIQNQVSNDPANIPDLTNGYRGIGWKNDQREGDSNKGKPNPNVKVQDPYSAERAEASAEITAFGQRNFPSAPFRPNVASPESEDLFNELNRGSNFPDQN